MLVAVPLATVCGPLPLTVVPLIFVVPPYSVAPDVLQVNVDEWTVEPAGMLTEQVTEPDPVLELRVYQ